MRRKFEFDENSLKTPKVSRSGAPVKLVVALVLIVGLLFGGLVVGINVMVDKDAIAKNVYDTLKATTGYDVMSESVSLKVFPEPTVILNNFVVVNNPRSATENMFQAQRVELVMGFDGVFGASSSALDAVKLVNPVLDLERFQDGKTNWEFASKTKALDAMDFSAVAFDIVDGSIIVNDMLTGKNSEFQGIQVNAGKSNGGLNFDAQATHEGNNFTLKGTAALGGLHDVDNFVVSPDIVLTQNAGELTYKGSLKRVAGNWRYDGAISVNTTDVLGWLKLVLDTSQKNNLVETVKTALPATINAELSSTETTQSIKNWSIKSGESDLTLNAEIDLAHEKPHLALDIRSNKLALEKLLNVNPNEALSTDMLEVVLRTLLTPDVNASVAMNVNAFSLASGVSGNLALAGDLDDGEFVVSQAQYSLPGDATVQLFGVAKVDAEKKSSFEGNLELKGKKFIDFTNGVGLGLGALLTDCNCEFQLQSMLTLSHNQSIISALEAQAGPIKLSAGLNLNSGDLLAVQGGVVLQGLKLDLLDAYIKANNVAKAKVGVGNPPIYFDWLHDVKSKYALNLELRDYTYKDKSHPQAKFGLQVSPDKLSLSNVNMPIGELFVKGALNYDQTQEKPVIDASLHLNQIDATSFSGNARIIKPVPKGNRQQIWSKEVFDLGLLQRFDGKFTLKVDQLKHSIFGMTDINFAFEAKDGSWNISQFDGKIWDGIFQAQGTITFNAISSISLAYIFQEVPAEKVLESVAGLQGLEGPITISGQVSATGLNLADWMNSNKGSITFNGHENYISGFDLAGLVQIMPQVRTIADVNAKVRDALLKNKTYVDTIEGSFSMENGVLNTNTMKMRSRDSITTVSGSIDLTTWMMNMGLQMKVLTLARGDFPTLNLYFSDSMDSPSAALDTKDLEAFVARRQSQ